MNRYFAGASLAVMVIASSASAQDISTTIAGTVQTTAGVPVAGAKLVITHIPSGSRSTTTTSASGQFEATGLRVGGPYSVTIAADGFQGQTISDISAGAGDTFQLNAQLQAADSGDAIVISASRLKRSGVLTTGSETSFSATDITAVSSAGRDIRDVARRDPLTSFDPSNRSLSIAGNQARANRFTIDGVAVQDDFGLNQGGLPSLRGIVSLAAIGEFSVKSAPFDVGNGNFTGGTLDAVLKSGTNEYHVEGNYEIGGKGLTGRNLRGVIAAQALPFRDYGAFVSGPIIKDKLFAAFNYERLTEGNPLITAGIFGEGAANPIPGIGDSTTFADDRAVVDQVRSIIKSRYKYDPLNTFVQLPERDRKISAKVDWNIIDGQRLSVTYIDHFNSVPSAGGGSSSSPNSPNVGLQSNSYEATEATKVYQGQLNSRWTDRFSTEARLSYRDYKRGQVGYGDTGFGQFATCTNPTDIITGTNPTNNATNCGANAQVTGGTDQFRQSNSLATNNLNGQFIAKYRLGDHRLKLQLEGSQQRVNNVFVPSSRGLFYFDSIADLNNGQANRVQFTNALSGNPVTGAASVFTLYSYAIGVQDEWSITPTLTALIGGRFDNYIEQKGDITANPFYAARYGGQSNQANLNNRSTFQPRIGFNWKPSERIYVAGGAGVFSGGVPLVLYSNSFANDGTRLNSIDLNRTFNAAGVATGTFTDRNNATLDPATIAQINAAGAAALNNVDGFGLQKNAVVNTYLSKNTNSLANAPTNSIDPNFKINSVVRLNLTGRYKLNAGSFFGDGWRLLGDLAVTLTRNGYTYTDLRAIPNGTLPDGRPRYQGLNGSGNSDLFLTNTGQGYAIVGAVGVSKDWDNGIGISGSYTRSTVRDLNSNINNSTASGGYGVATNDPNHASLGTSTLQVRDQARLQVSYKHSFFRDYETEFNLFGSWRDGRPFSFTFADPAPGRGNVFGTTNGGRYLIYVPNLSNITIPGGPGVQITPLDAVAQYSGTATDVAAFRDYVLNSPLRNSQGKITAKGTGKNPDFTQIDLHLSQQIPTFVGHSRITVFGDVDNLLNLFSDKFAFRQFGDTVTLVDVTCLSAAGAVVTGLNQACASYRYSNFKNPTTAAQTRQSLWTVRLGVKFEL
jgi:hypothetical protein